MSIQLTEPVVTNVLTVRVSGKLEREDYLQFVPEFERLLEKHGKIRVLFEMEDFHGWKAGALWEDLKFEFRHFADVERIAMVGEGRWEKAMSIVCRPFTTAKIRYFDRAAVDAAKAWLNAS